MDVAAPGPVEEAAATVVLPRLLIDAADGQRRLSIPLPAQATVADVLDAIAVRHPRLERRVRDEAGGLRRFVNLYLDGEEVRRLQGLATPIAPGQEVRILQSVAGG
ncbi:MAG: MoaD/ThiS family protein [Actinomycetota bacterium]|nr:MoaD/ThiS family protein [Actinomycetota bacterium]